MMKVNWSSLSESLPDIEISVTVAEFAVKGPQLPFGIKVQIREYTNSRYLGFSNVSFWGPRQAMPYKSSHFTDTPEGALIHLVESLARYQNMKDGKRYVFWVMDDPSDPKKFIYLDSTGVPVTLGEVEKRRSKWHKNPYHDN